ncbi:Small nuclear ribonucleoprotein family protein [Trifolium repens]|nr:Small nuclear ribonucleoprotein family protein [Trifolium repens]
MLSTRAHRFRKVLTNSDPTRLYASGYSYFKNQGQGYSVLIPISFLLLSHSPPPNSLSFILISSTTMSRSGQPPDLKKYMDKQLQIKLNANRMIVGTLRGFDQFMNLVIDNTVEVNGNEKNEIGMVVIRGNSVVTIEALEPVVNRIS